MAQSVLRSLIRPALAAGRLASMALPIVLGLPVFALAQDGAAPDVPTVPVPPVAGAGDLPRDLSPLGMFMSADPLVKAVLIGLVFASVVTWTVWLAKTIELWSAKRRVRRALQRLASARSTVAGVERLSARDGEVRAFLDAAVTELKLSDGAFERDGIK